MRERLFSSLLRRIMTTPPVSSYGARPGIYGPAWPAYYLRSSSDRLRSLLQAISVFHVPPPTGQSSTGIRTIPVLDWYDLAVSVCALVATIVEQNWTTRLLGHVLPRRVDAGRLGGTFATLL